MARITQEDIEALLERCCSGALPPETAQKVLFGLLSAIAAGAGSSPIGATAGEFTWTSQTEAAGSAGTVVAGQHSVSFLNTGVDVASVNGENLQAGDSISVEAFLDPVLGIYNLTPAAAFDTLTSSLRIDIVAKDT